MTKDERLYIAGPNCFWPKGGNTLQSYREYALYQGYDTTLPGDPKKMEEKQKERKPFGEMTKKERGASILENCATSMDDTTAILANLDNYRGFSPDGGTIGSSARYRVTFAESSKSSGVAPGILA
ncbi:MAG: nucleoside 2-deoxyribosyltransferase [Oscillospiraceae bacterium]|nr:nucleoside 2-deoxyribosyltransferase [Oscillospiraceae bacterium]